MQVTRADQAHCPIYIVPASLSCWVLLCFQLDGFLTLFKTCCFLCVSRSQHIWSLAALPSTALFITWHIELRACLTVLCIIYCTCNRLVNLFGNDSTDWTKWFCTSDALICGAWWSAWIVITQSRRYNMHSSMAVSTTNCRAYYSTVLTSASCTFCSASTVLTCATTQVNTYHLAWH